MSYSIIRSINISEILITYANLKNNITWLDNPGKGKQSGLQYANNEDPFLSATGKLKDNRDEKEYINLNPLFKGTVFEDIIKEYNLYRTRLMWIEPKTCYSLHKDTTQRIHIPIVTNKNCMFLFPDEPLIHLPIGLVYSVDTRKTHTFCNFSNYARLHLLGCY
jgi:hypothetical protein